VFLVASCPVEGMYPTRSDRNLWRELAGAVDGCNPREVDLITHRRIEVAAVATGNSGMTIQNFGTKRLAKNRAVA